LTFPADFTADPGLLEQFKSIPGLTQESAQPFVELYQRGFTEASERYWNETAAQWETETKADPEIGGSHLDGIIATVQPLLQDESLTDPGFRALLDTYGLGSNPAVIRTLYRWAMAIEGR
jgi:hypothetical protein